MPEFETSRVVAHSAAHMFDLVADVRKYPEFVPLCEGLTVRSEMAEGERRVLVADMTVGYRMLRETFTSKVTLDRPSLAITADYLNGPFRAMENHWRFVERTPHECSVTFRIAYEFRSRALAALMGAVFDRAFRKFAHAFEVRADAVYGKSGTGRPSQAL